MFWDVIRYSDITWNFEKFIIKRDGEPLYRLTPKVAQYAIPPLLEEALADHPGGM